MLLLTFLSIIDIIRSKGGVLVETIGDRVKYIRKKILNNKSQKEFGDLLGLKPNSISCIETGASNLTEQTANAICREFGINKEWLINGTPPIKKSDDIDEYSDIAMKIGEKDPKAKQAIMDYWKLTDTDKELFWKFVDKFILKKED